LARSKERNSAHNEREVSPNDLFAQCTEQILEAKKDLRQKEKG